MRIPREEKKIGPWAAEIISACMSDLEERIQRGALYRNLYLTGDENGNPATYPKTFEYIETLRALFFSPLELHYQVKIHGGGNLTEQAQGRVVASEMHEYMADAGVYESITEATRWSLVKGKTFEKLLWEGGGFSPYMIQPEFMGVLRPDINDLNRQPAFVHTTYYTPSEFETAFRELPEIDKIMRDINKRGNRGRPDERPDRTNALKQIVLGGLNPYQQAGNSPATNSTRGLVNWLGGPQATFDPKIMAQLIRLDELWVKDSVTDDWATFQSVGDILVTGGKVIRNAFSDIFDPDNTSRRLSDKSRDHNPLSRLHPFVEFSATSLDGYFWGRSECCNVGVLQMQINSRLNGIARLLRRQENPPQLMTGSNMLNQQKYSVLDKPGGFFSDPSPTGKLNPLYPELPQGLWESLHELERIFDEMGGRPPIMRGMGDPGVRSQGHAETLTANASPRFKDAALCIERSVSSVGQLGLQMLKAMDNRQLTAWLPPNTQNVVALTPPDQPELEAPAEGMKPLPFHFYHVPENARVRVDSHSSSPIFSREARSLIFDLAKLGAMSPTEVVEHVHPPGEDEIVASIERREIGREKQLASLPPDLRAKALAGRKH